MKPSSRKRTKSSNRNVRSRFLFPLAFCFLSVAFYSPLHAPRLVIAQTIEARKAEADRLLQQGLQQYQTRQFSTALDSWQQALQIYRTIKNRQGEGIALGKLGATYLKLGNSVQAVEYIQQNLAVTRELKDRNWEGKVLGALGAVYLELGNYGKVIEYSQQQLVIVRTLRDRRAEGGTLGMLGVAYLSLSDLDKAIEYGQQQLVIAHELKDRQEEWKALNLLGLAYHFLSNYDKAVEYSQQQLATARAIQDRPGEAAALSVLGVAYLDLGNYDKVIEYGQQQLTIARAIQDRKSEGSALVNLGTAYLNLGNYGKAIEYGQQQLTIARATQDRQGEGRALNILGNAYHSLGNYIEAIEYSQQSLTIARAIQDHSGESTALSSLGGIYVALGNYDKGNYDKAIEYGQQQLTIARASRDRQEECEALGMLGLAYTLLDNYDKAIEYSQQSLAIARAIQNRQSENVALSRLGIAHYFLGNYNKAIEYFQQSLAIAHAIQNREDEGLALSGLELTYGHLGNYNKAIGYGQQRLAIARAIQNRQSEGGALSSLGSTFLKAGNPAEAERMLINSIQVWESMRQMLGSNDTNKVAIFEGQDDTYRTLQQVWVAQNNPNAALEIAERGRARAFVDLLTQRLSSGNANSISTSAPNQAQIRQVAKAQNATLVEYSIIYDAFQLQGRQRRLESLLYIWVIQPTGEITFRQVDLKPLWQQHKVSLADLIIGNQEFLAVRSRSDRSTTPQPDLPTLHQLLIDPIATLLPKDPNAQIIFIPQGSLFQVPFPALQDANGNYLIQKHTIRTAPSIQVLALTRQQQKLANRQQNRGPALVVGNPTMPTAPSAPGTPKQPLSNLPEAETEAKVIAPLLNTQAIIGAQGTKATIKQKMPDASIIHLATHGRLNDFRGLDSAIALAPSNGDDGWLTAGEILDMRLQASLVVLSACYTGEGRITGDGVIGLSRSLISAGVPSVIVSLWAIPDAPTALLMKAFYQNLQKNPDKARALRQAMLTTMKTHPQPRDWAAFTLIGETE